VHREAVARDAGILFLGDFWHVRGALPVEPLNAALHEMRAWTQPTVMLPGNHDQVLVNSSHRLPDDGSVSDEPHSRRDPVSIICRPLSCSRHMPPVHRASSNGARRCISLRLLSWPPATVRARCS
jgi:hypothetical protein